MPKLTVRHPSYSTITQPLRVILDAKGKVPACGPLFDQQLAPTLIVTTHQSPQSRRDEWLETGAEVVDVSPSSTGVDLKETWQLLGKRLILQVLVEGGAILHSALIDSSLVNRLVIYIGPLLLGSCGYPFYQKEISSLQQSRRLSLKTIQQLGESVRLDYTLS